MKEFYQKSYSNSYERIGEIDILIPDVPDNCFIDNTHIPRRNQKFSRIEEPDEFKALSMKEKKAHWFVGREYSRKRNGYWFMNNGVPTYISGFHYIYLQWWTLNSGVRPSYRSADRKVFLFFDHCLRDQDSLGMLYFTQRRAGKTSIAAFLNFIIISSMKNAHGGIQSKDDPGGQMVFQKHLLRGLKRLPDWLKPVRSGSETPKGNELSFSEPGEMITKKKLKEGSLSKSDNALNSRISYGPSTETYYDGEMLHFYHADEIGKVDRVNAVKRHDIVVPCMMIGRKIIGKAFYTTTVEDIGKNALKNAKELWDGSDPNARDENNRTSSKLYRYFKPACDGYEGFIDEFGNSQEEEAKKYILAERKALLDKGDLERWASIVRKFPLDPSEPFTPNAQDCHFDAGKLSLQKRNLENRAILMQPASVRGDLVWVGSRPAGWRIEDHGDMSKLVRSEVAFVPSPNGKFLRSIPPNHSNNVGVDYDGSFMPRNSGIYSGGIDPFDFSVTSSGKGSKGGGAIFVHPNPIEPEDSDRWAMIYIHRPDINTEFYEDMAKMLHYYGCPAVVERNKAMCRNYLASRGFERFIYGKLRLDPTIPRKKSDNVAGEYTGKTHLIAITDAFQSYIYENYEKIDFTELIDQLFGWSIPDSNKFDLVIAAGFALLAARHSKQYVERKLHDREAEAIQQFFTLYDYSGNKSTKVR